MKIAEITTLVLLTIIFTAACVQRPEVNMVTGQSISGQKTGQAPLGKVTKTQDGDNNTEDNLIKDIDAKYKNSVPKAWGENVSGVITRIGTKDKVIALTFDACGGKGGSGYDKDLIDYLEKEHIPATLFINSRWIDENYNTFMSLAKNPLFEIENHGTEHRPLSVNGRSAYGINGTKDAAEVVNEVAGNQLKIQKLTGRTPKYFRSGTAYYDDVAVKIVNALGEKPVNFSVLGDAGATFSKSQIEKACLKATSGSIIIFHMNHPEKQTAEGVKLVVPELQKRGFRFVRLEDYDSSLK